MQKSLVLIISIIVLAIGAGIAAFVYTLREADDSTTNDTTATVREDSSTTATNEEPDVSTGLDNEKHLQGANIGETVDATGQTEVTVDIDDFIFKTTTLKVKKGTTVTWVNNGSVQHDVTSTTNSPKQGLASDMLGNGEKYSYTFNEAGTYQYFCSPHPTQMRGVVEVIE